MSNGNIDTYPTADPVTGEILATEPTAIVAPTWADEYCALVDRMEAVRLDMEFLEGGYRDEMLARMDRDDALNVIRNRLIVLASEKAVYDEKIEDMLADAPEGFSVDSGRFRVRKPKRRETWRLGKTAKALAGVQARDDLTEILRGVFPEADWERVTLAAEAVQAWLEPERKLGQQAAPVVTVRPPEVR